MGEGLFAAWELAWLSEDVEGVEDPGRRVPGRWLEACFGRVQSRSELLPVAAFPGGEDLGALVGGVDGAGEDGAETAFFHLVDRFRRGAAG